MNNNSNKLTEYEELKRNNKDLALMVDKLSKELKSYQCQGKHSNQCLCAFRCLGNEFCNDADNKIKSYQQILKEIKYFCNSILNDYVHYSEGFIYVAKKIKKIANVAKDINKSKGDLK